MSAPTPGTTADPSELSQEQRVFGDLFFELRDGLELTKRLMGRYEAGRLDEVERAEAGQGARRLAVEGRIGFDSLARMNERAPDLFPRYSIALRVATRLAYCLLALAGDDPEPLALVSSSELDTILRDEGGDERIEELLAMVPANRNREDGGG